MSITNEDRAPAASARRLKVPPHHRFEFDGNRYLLVTDTLRVMREDALTSQILNVATSSNLASALAAAIAAPDADAPTFEARVEELRDHGVLVEDGAAPKELDVGTGTTATFMINVSQRCNLTCAYCYVNEGRFDYPEAPIKKMPRATFEALVPRVFALFPGYHSYAFHFYGGEPLLNFAAIRVICEAASEIAKAHGANLQFYITTNGTLINEEIADFFDRFGFNVYFSIDGDKSSHDQYRKYRNGKGSFDDVMRNFDLLKSRPHIHIIGSSVVRDGFSLGEAIAFLQQHGADSCKAERVRLGDGAAGALQGAERDRYLRDTRDLVNHYVDAIANGRKPMDFRLISKILQLLLRKRRSAFCAAGERMFGIAANGEIYPCALHVGRANSKLGTLAQGVDRETARDFRRRYSAQSQARCQDCWARNLCGGGCSAMIDRFGHEDCEALRAEAEAAIVVFDHFAKPDPMQLLTLVDPNIVAWMNSPS